jgi:hypothetical protein
LGEGEEGEVLFVHVEIVGLLHRAVGGISIDKPNFDRE